MPTTSGIDAIAVVAPSTTNNSIGRAMVLADIAARLANRVSFLAHADGQLWPGARSYSAVAIDTFDEAEDLGRRLDGLASRTGQPLIVWVLKPWAESADWVWQWSAGREDVRLWFDEDDFDEGVHDDWIGGLDVLRRVAFRAVHPRSPRRIRQRVRQWGDRAELLTTSSFALGARLGWPAEKTARVPHARASVEWRAPSRKEQLRFGFLGTPKAYKGVQVFAQLLDWYPEAELHVFEGTQRGFGLRPDQLARVVTHAGDVPGAAASALDSVDIVVLPQSRDTEASEYQLPAKLIDALQIGRPVLTTATATISEFIKPGVFTVEDWTDRKEVGAVIEPLLNETQRLSLGRALAMDFRTTHSTDAVCAALSERWLAVSPASTSR